MNDLDWLARNVHVWVGGDYLIRVGSECYTFREHCEGETVGANWFTRDQWLTRRAELQNKPNWDDAPEWAEWLAQHSTGCWIWGRGEAIQAAPSLWYSPDTGVTELISMGGEVLGSWRDTLERRPQAAKPEPSSDDWYKRGDLPPVGIECEIFVDGGWDAVFVVGFSRQGYLTVQFSHGGITECEGCQFRPLPTERERVASELVDVMMAVPARDSETTSEHHMRVALAVYDHLHKDDVK